MIPQVLLCPVKRFPSGSPAVAVEKTAIFSTVIQIIRY